MASTVVKFASLATVVEFASLGKGNARRKNILWALILYSINILCNY